MKNLKFIPYILVLFSIYIQTNINSTNEAINKEIKSKENKSSEICTQNACNLDSIIIKNQNIDWNNFRFHH
ncbi:hypothetical protein CIG2463D_0127 [Campylobacter iguaniorum]|uniref:Uncharacterized protein n=1 Tax=Campylobacter iguaniorum TaxID=1244531 RepID=A0A076F972_9BACT|nr:hypothetical protein [Campylobacter iguaniorum]AII14002.1 hypothetical protein CIG1485E_0124 [Campylobacter iguaniorum]ALV23740.1 hypothetical protein CIG2463D_0127 [Campylobacter iguaniorum]